jgi:hypothetical protein
MKRTPKETQLTLEEKVVEYFKQGLPIGTIASYCTTNKQVVTEILKKKNLL